MVQRILWVGKEDAGVGGHYETIILIKLSKRNWQWLYYLQAMCA